MFKYKVAHGVGSYLKFWIQKKILRKKEFNVPIELLSRNAYNVGDRIGQIIILPYPQIEFVEVDMLSETERGTGGYGSSGK